MKILFISRAYPPITGGIENQNYALSVWLNKVASTDTIANRRGKKFLPFFLPLATLRALWCISRYDVLLLGDGVLGIVGYIVKIFFPKKSVIAVIHGLDITYRNSIYQNVWVRFFLPKLDGLIAVGNETIRQGVARGIPEEKLAFIPNGVDTEAHFEPHTREELEKLLGVSLTNKHVLLTSGRLAKRKGVAWFIRNVIPKLPDNILYVVAGDGVDKQNIDQAVQETHSADRVKLLGYVSDEVRNILFNTCDIFIQPNIPIEGDMEGFGISVIEAASCELPVIVSNLEGLKDAIHQNENGLLVEPENADAFKEAIMSLFSNEEARLALGKRARQYTKDHFEWDAIAKQYLQTIESFMKK
jgi:glycosyltransferase involved in cell wall biosynthesis